MLPKAKPSGVIAFCSLRRADVSDHSSEPEPRAGIYFIARSGFGRDFSLCDLSPAWGASQNSRCTCGADRRGSGSCQFLFLLPNTRDSAGSRKHLSTIRYYFSGADLLGYRPSVESNDKSNKQVIERLASSNIDGLVYEGRDYASLANLLASKWSVRTSLKLEAGMPGTAIAYYRLNTPNSPPFVAQDRDPDTHEQRRDPRGAVASHEITRTAR
jgi:hypothetical protein